MAALAEMKAETMAWRKRRMAAASKKRRRKRRETAMAVARVINQGSGDEMT
jgi:hypothetical protein